MAKNTKTKNAPQDAEKDKAQLTPEDQYNKALLHFEKRFKTKKIFSMASKEFINHSVPRVSYGELGLDAILYGGAPQGRIIKIAGKFSSGKSTALAHYVAIKTTILKQKVFLVDYEYAWTREWLVAIGADIRYITVGYPETLEEALDMLEMMYLTGYFDDVLFESLSASSPEDEVEADNDEWTQSLKARLANKFFRKMESHQNSFVGRSVMPPTFQFTGHVFSRLHDKIKKEGTSGGNQQDNSSTVIIGLSQSKKITEDTGKAKDETEDDGEKEVFGFMVRAKCEKNKLSPPFKTTSYGILFEPFRGHRAGSFFHANTLIRIAEKMGIIEKAGSYYGIPGAWKMQGIAATEERLIGDRDTFEMVVEAVKSVYAKNTADEDNPDGVVLPYDASYAYLPEVLRSRTKAKLGSEVETGGNLSGGNVITEAEAKEMRKNKAAKKKAAKK